MRRAFQHRDREKEHRMRAVLTISYILLALAALAGCGAPKVVPTPSAAAPAAAPLPAATAPQRPFPQHTSYTAGTIKPSQHTQAQLDAAVQAAYRAWKRAYLRSGCGTGRYYVDPGGDVSGGKLTRSITVSEGHGYRMVISAFMAGVDPDARQIFGGLYAFFRDHPSSGSPDLMAWKQVEGCANIDLRNTGSATDAYMDIAYALLLADRQWGSGGPIDYRKELRKRGYRAAISQRTNSAGELFTPRRETFSLAFDQRPAISEQNCRTSFGSTSEFLPAT
jgi:hypothetical protein